MSKSIAFDVKNGDLKLCIENAMRVFRYQNEKNFIIARIANLYGPGQDYRKGVGFIDAAIKHAMNGENEIPYDVINISSGQGVTQNEVLDVIKRYYPQIKVEYQPARTVDADIIYLCNDRLKSIYKKPMVSLEDGIEAYYIYLKTSKDEFDQGLS